MLSLEIKTETQIKEAIIRVIVFFDLFDYPLSAYEIWEYLDKVIALNLIIEIIPEINNISQTNGFYFLSGREEIITTRQKRNNYSIRKIKIARRFIRIFSLLPFIKVIALSNSIGQHNLRDGSDIDFFIISAPRRVWLTRLFCAGIAKLLNSRPTAQNKRDKICLSFYLTSNNLNLDSLKLSGEDPYFHYWLRGLVLLYNKDKSYEDFLRANKLLFSELSSSQKNAPVKKRNYIIDRLEIGAKKFQLKIMSPELKTAMNNSGGVVVNDKVLKLYLHDNRQLYAEKYGIKIHQFFKKSN